MTTLLSRSMVSGSFFSVYEPKNLVSTAESSARLEGELLEMIGRIGQNSYVPNDGYISILRDSEEASSRSPCIIKI